MVCEVPKTLEGGAATRDIAGLAISHIHLGRASNL